MANQKPLGIRPALWLALALTVSSTLLGAAALYGYQLYHRTQKAEELRAQALAAAYAAQAAGWLSQSREEMCRQIDSLRWHPDVCLLAVIATPGRAPGGVPVASREPPRLIKLRGDERLLTRFFDDNDAIARGLLHLQIPPPQGSRQPWPRLCIASAPLALPKQGTAPIELICGVRSASRYIFSPREIGVFFARLMLTAAAASLLGFWWLRRTVVQPLAVLAESSARATTASSLPRIHADRNDEIGDLARTLSDMHWTLEEWRERATRLERSVNQRVESATQHVTRELQQANREIWTDPLTRLGNRRLLEDQFASIVAAQQRTGNDLSVIMMDVDNFKTLNDGKGHKAGDELLRFIGELLKQSLREGDLAVRYGGDEFILILPSVTLRDAASIAQRTILLFNQQARLLDIEPRPSMSAGVASLWEQRPKSPDELLELADAALYQGKRRGKSCVTTAVPRPPVRQPVTTA